MDDKIRGRLESIENRIVEACKRSGRARKSVRLIAVTKTHPVETVQALIDLGIRDIGENRSWEIEEKAPLLKGEYSLHMIGHLQTNKAGKILPYVKWIQSIDSEHLVTRIENLYSDTGKINALVEVNTSGEEAKTGCAPGKCLDLCGRVLSSKALSFRGLMTIGPLEGGEQQVRDAFRSLRKLGEECQRLYQGRLDGRFELSMGMSGDFEWAIEEGSTMVRIGTAILGERE
jgi:PLP dependent protein